MTFSAYSTRSTSAASERGELLRKGLQLDHIMRTPTNIRHRCNVGYE